MHNPLSLASIVLLMAAPLLAGNVAAPVADPVLEAPTLHCLGVYWIIRDDDNRNARVLLDYRKTSDSKWQAGAALFRVDKGPYANGDERRENMLHPPADAWVFAGSVFFLEPDTAYELKLTLSDPDGGAASKILHSRTIAEPQLAPGGPAYHVVPSSRVQAAPGHPGIGTAADPFRGLAAAQSHAKPGDLLLLHAGTYAGTFEIEKSGKPGAPIVWRGAGDGEAILDGGDPAQGKNTRTVAASGAHDVWFEDLTVRNAGYGIVAHEAERIVVRRCHITAVECGIVATRNTRGNVSGFFISDNVIEGPSTWPRSRGIEDARGIQISGTGQVVCYNRVRGFADAIDTFPSPVCCAIDFHNNEISECTDDGSEMDASQRNTRNYLNRYTNIFQGISVQPIYGGPVYIFRNTLCNVVGDPFKLHNSPSGAVVFHNTVVKSGMPSVLSTREKISNCVYRNNLFVGNGKGYAYECGAPAERCDFDYDGYAGGPFEPFLKWNGVRYKTLAEVKAKAPIERHATLVDLATVFATGLQPPADAKKQLPLTLNDLRLKPGSAAIDAGEKLPGWNDGYTDKAPDLGAYELGAPLPYYGPRPRQ